MTFQYPSIYTSYCFQNYKKTHVTSGIGIEKLMACIIWGEGRPLGPLSISQFGTKPGWTRTNEMAGVGTLLGLFWGRVDAMNWTQTQKTFISCRGRWKVHVSSFRNGLVLLAFLGQVAFFQRILLFGAIAFPFLPLILRVISWTFLHYDQTWHKKKTIYSTE